MLGVESVGFVVGGIYVGEIGLWVILVTQRRDIVDCWLWLELAFGGG